MLGRKSASNAIKEPMRKIFLAVVVAVLPTWIAVAQPSSQPPKNSPKSGTLYPVKKNPCAQYGVGFAKIARIHALRSAAALASKVAAARGANSRDVRFWHKADNLTAPAFVRYLSNSDIATTLGPMV